MPAPCARGLPRFRQLVGAAIGQCSAALRLDASLTAARNNLALAFAASGRMDLARTHFLDAGDRASGLYNAGIAYLASGDEPSALAAFDEASRARPFQLTDNPPRVGQHILYLVVASGREPRDPSPLPGRVAAAVASRAPAR